MKLYINISFLKDKIQVDCVLSNGAKTTFFFSSQEKLFAWKEKMQKDYIFID